MEAGPQVAVGSAGSASAWGRGGGLAGAAPSLAAPSLAAVMVEQIVEHEEAEEAVLAVRAVQAVQAVQAVEAEAEADLAEALRRSLLDSGAAAASDGDGTSTSNSNSISTNSSAAAPLGDAEGGAVEEDKDCDYLFALRLQEEELHVGGTESDHLLALRLQENLRASDASEARERAHTVGAAKVSVVWSGGFLGNVGAVAGDDDDDDDGDHDDDDFDDDGNGEYDDLEEELHAHGHGSLTGGSLFADAAEAAAFGAAQADAEAAEAAEAGGRHSPSGGRLPRGVFLLTRTKHDPVLEAVRNARRVERCVPSGGDMSGLRVSSGVFSRLAQASRRQNTAYERVRGNRADRSTFDRVLDAGTRTKLLQMLNADLLAEVGGLVATGKEANVYFARAGARLCSHVGTGLGGGGGGDDGRAWSAAAAHASSGTPCAVKLFKTRLTEFRNRLEYLEGDFRYRRKGARRGSDLTVVKLWAEKEMRNLRRLCDGGVACPVPLCLRRNILVMSFLGGADGRSAPRLREAAPYLSARALSKCYADLVLAMRTMFHRCHLVHADLSEFNVLYWRERPFIIDVGQAVHFDAPLATDYLKRDCAAITRFFAPRCPRVLCVRALFDFVTDVGLAQLDADSLARHLEDVRDAANASLAVGGDPDEGVFLRSFTPRCMRDVLSPEHGAIHPPLTLPSNCVAEARGGDAAGGAVEGGGPDAKPHGGDLRERAGRSRSRSTSGAGGGGGGAPAAAAAAAGAGGTGVVGAESSDYCCR